jgi:hypothetical protein
MKFHRGQYKRSLKDKCCYVCGHKSNSTSNHLRHTRTHFALKPRYACAICKYKFCRSDSYKRHLSRRHPGCTGEQYPLIKLQEVFAFTHEDLEALVVGMETETPNLPTPVVDFQPIRDDNAGEGPSQVGPPAPSGSPTKSVLSHSDTDTTSIPSPIEGLDIDENDEEIAELCQDNPFDELINILNNPSPVPDILYEAVEASGVLLDPTDDDYYPPPRSGRGG